MGSSPGLLAGLGARRRCWVLVVRAQPAVGALVDAGLATRRFGVAHAEGEKREVETLSVGGVAQHRPPVSVSPVGGVGFHAQREVETGGVVALGGQELVVGQAVGFEALSPALGVLAGVGAGRAVVSVPCVRVEADPPGRAGEWAADEG